MKYEREKGRRGQAAAFRLLRERDWVVDPITAGVAREDLIATDMDGNVWCVEVKNTASITKAHRDQAIRQAAKRRLRWMLMSKIVGTPAWLVQRQGRKPVVWCERGDGDDDEPREV